MAGVRILLTDEAIAQLPAPNDGWYLARDTELKGFFVVVGKRKRTFTVQGNLRKGGKRCRRSGSRSATRAKSRREPPAPPQRNIWLRSVGGGTRSRRKMGSAAQVRMLRTRRRQRTPRSSRRGGDIWKPVWFGKTAAKGPSPATAIMWNAFSRNGLTPLWPRLAQIQPAWRKSTTMVTLTPSDANSVTIASESPRPQTSRPNRGPGLSTRSVPRQTRS